MRAIFLDFDGVIRMSHVADGHIHGEFCPDRMERVAGLARDCDAKIVVSSDWRQGYGFSEIAGFLEPSIPRNLLHRDWMTPLLRAENKEDDVIVPRGAEILAWMFRNPGTREYVIIDDLEAAYFPLMEDRHVSCDPDRGFTSERCLAARRALLA